MLKKLVLALATAATILVGVNGVVSGAEAASEPVYGAVMVVDQTGKIIRGSGLYLKGGYVVTNSHVINRAEGPFYAVDSDWNRQEMKIVADDKERDLALAKVAFEKPYLKVADEIKSSEYRSISNHSDYFMLTRSGPYIGSSVVTMYSDKDGEMKLDNHWFRNLFRMESQPGNSGSPIVNDNGELVGVVVGNWGPDVTVAVTLEDIRVFLNKNMKEDSL